MFNVKITQVSFAFLFSSSSSAASSLLKSWSSTLHLRTYISQHCCDNVAAERQRKSTCHPSMVCMCPSGKDIETNRLWGQLEFLSPSWKCLPDPVVSVTGPLLASSPPWWMATFPFFIALLNHALTMLLWPIFAALFDFPLFLNETPKAEVAFSFCRTLLHIILIFEGLSLQWCSGGDSRCSSINQTHWDKCVRPCLAWRNVLQKNYSYQESKYFQNISVHSFEAMYFFLTFTSYLVLYSTMICGES